MSALGEQLRDDGRVVEIDVAVGQVLDALVALTRDDDDVARASLRQRLADRLAAVEHDRRVSRVGAGHDLVRDGLRSFVFVQKADGTFDRRRIELGRADDRFVEIKSGLTSGEMIATSGVPQIQTAYAAVR